MTDFSAQSIQELLSREAHSCSCGRSHDTELSYVRIESGAVRYLPEALETLSVSCPFVVFDQNTYQATGEKVLGALRAAGIDHRLFIYGPMPLKMEPDEYAVGALTMAAGLAGKPD